MIKSSASVGSVHHGSGHYSDDRQRWWDDEDRRWHNLSEETETLEIVIEDVSERSWLASLVATLGSQFGGRYYRFVGVIRAGHPHPVDRVESGTFACPRTVGRDIPPQEQWAFGMTRELNGLRKQLIDEGWFELGHGPQPWSYTYFRPCLASATPPPPTADPGK
jgi:hypothetical protein